MGTAATPYLAPRFIASPVRTSDIYVLFTTLGGTLAAIRAAAALSRALGAQLRLLDPRALHIPLRAAGYALATTPDTPMEEREREQVIAAAGVPVGVQAYVCGQPANIGRTLRDHSLIVVGGRRSWWPTAVERLQRALEQQGHAVMFVNECQD